MSMPAAVPTKSSYNATLALTLANAIDVLARVANLTEDLLGFSYPSKPDGEKGGGIMGAVQTGEFNITKAKCEHLQDAIHRAHACLNDLEHSFDINREMPATTPIHGRLHHQNPIGGMSGQQEF